MNLLISLLVLSLMIFIHELGHFLAARACGVRVEVFSIGFWKKLIIYRHNGTEYAISAIPLGGYVKMKGQDDSDPLRKNFDSDSYNAKTPLQRLAILGAGPFANFLLAFFLYIGVGIIGQPDFAPKIGEVSENMPALQAGLQKNDLIVAINEQPMRSWSEASAFIKESKGELNILVQRAGKERYIKVVPLVKEAKNIFGETIERRFIGIAPSGERIVVEHSLLESIPFAFNETIEASKLIVQSLQKLLMGIVPASEIGGVISIVEITSKASNAGIVTLLAFSALISVNLGVLNLLPIPALDGGHIMFTLYEMLFKRPPAEAVLYRLTLGGWAILLALMSLGIYNDLMRIATGTMP